MWIRELLPFLGVIYIFMTVIPGITGLECYNCKGVTYFDPDRCFSPHPEHTIQQQCRKGDSCEKKIVQVDGWTVKVERGCSANCNNRDFIWSEDFRVYCCKQDNLCNDSSFHHRIGLWSTLCTLTLGLLVWVGCGLIHRT